MSYESCHDRLEQQRLTKQEAENKLQSLKSAISTSPSKMVQFKDVPEEQNA